MVGVSKSLLKIWIRKFLRRLGRKDRDFTFNLINKLPITPKEKIIMELRYIEGLTWDEIANHKGVYLSKARVVQIEKECIETLEFLIF